jgi:hypothetical protein
MVAHDVATILAYYSRVGKRRVHCIRALLLLPVEGAPRDAPLPGGLPISQALSFERVVVRPINRACDRLILLLPRRPRRRATRWRKASLAFGPAELWSNTVGFILH